MWRQVSTSSPNATVSVASDPELHFQSMLPTDTYQFMNDSVTVPSAASSPWPSLRFCLLEWAVLIDSSSDMKL